MSSPINKDCGRNRESAASKVMELSKAARSGAVADPRRRAGFARRSCGGFEQGL
ncbi:hypothetical protein Hdeb2414_s0009g00307961 [Helianthus debilis subsp. tardiflorus]